MEYVVIAFFAAVALGLAEDIVTGLQNTRNYNHSDDYWIAAVGSLAALAAYLAVVFS